jgi:hypothetical protein
MDDRVDTSTALDQTNSALVDLKMPLVLRDYQSYFEAASRVDDRMGRLREWEISLVAALSVLLLSQQPTAPIAFLPLYFVIAVFWIFEAGERASIKTIAAEVIEKERKLSARDLPTFRQNISEWEFGNSIVAKRSRPKLYWLAVKSLFHPRILVWHVGLAAALSALVFFVRKGHVHQQT